MGYNTQFINKRVADIGAVKFTFDDGTEVTNNIDFIGETWFDQNSSRSPIKIETMGQSWIVEETILVPGTVNYPNGEIGQLPSVKTVEDPTGDTIILWREDLDTTAYREKYGS